MKLLMIMVLLCGLWLPAQDKPTVNVRDYAIPAWYVAQREARKVLPKHTADIRIMRPPQIEFSEGLIELETFWGTRKVLGQTSADGRLIRVAITDRPEEDFATEVHEMIHSIALRLQDATPYERDQLHLFVDYEWRVGQY